MPPPALPGRTGQALKWAVSILVIVAIGLGSWQLADTLNSRENSSTSPTPTGQKAGQDPTTSAAPSPLQVVGAKEFAPDGNPQDSGNVDNTYDGSASTYWQTKTFLDGPGLAPYKSGVGIVYDLGSAHKVSSASIDFTYSGDHTTVEIYAADSLSPSSDLSQLTKLGSTQTTQDKINVELTQQTQTRYVLIWLTALPHAPAEQSLGAGYRQAIAETSFTG